MNRDLRVDLEWINKARKSLLETKSHAMQRRLEYIFLEKAQEGWPHAIERAIEAEALARELVEALKHIERLAELARRRSRYPGAVMSCGAEIRLAVEGALEKAKEVLGDGSGGD